MFVRNKNLANWLGFLSVLISIVLPSFPSKIP
jgi:hypothetical protein